MPHDDYEPLDVAGPADLDLGPLDLLACLDGGAPARLSDRLLAKGRRPGAPPQGLSPRANDHLQRRV
jgi:hypothetical protein